MEYTIARETYDSVKARLMTEWEEARLLVEERLAELVRELDQSAMPEVVKHIVAGGKRFRGFLVILTAKALGAPPSSAVDAAAAIELVQAASLAIDDIVDGDRTRRGVLSAWARFGIPQAVLTSLLLIPIAQRIVEQLGFKALFHVIRAWETTVRGEIMDTLLAPNLPPSSYLRLIEMKTAALFSLSTILGALSAGVRDDKVIQAYAEYGRLIGVTYQLADDIADYTVHVSQGRKLDPGEELFIKWARTLDPESPVDAAIGRLHDFIRQTMSAARNLPMERPEYRPILETLPLLLTRKLFEEAKIHDKIRIKLV